MKRHAHVIKHNKGKELPQRVMFVDTETNYSPDENGDAVHTLKLGVACLAVFDKEGQARSKTYTRFTRSNQFWDLVVESAYDKTRLYLTAHNTQFDLKVLKAFSSLKRRGFKLKKLIINGSSSIIEFRKGKATILILDNLNFFKSSLANLGEDIGIPKMDMPTTNNTLEEWFIYCKRDVEVMVHAWEVWMSFINIGDLGCFAKTLAGQAFNAYRHRFMQAPLYVHTSEPTQKLERESYHGGRVECFYIGTLDQGPYYNLDVNSMYPSVMATNEYPTRYIKTIISPSHELLKNLIDMYAIVGRFRLSTLANIYCTVIDGRLCFPTGEFEAVLTTQEAKRALDAGWILGIGEVAIYEKHVIFSQYVHYFYNRRSAYKKEGNTSFAYLCKLMLNSLYGKFGQRNDVWETIAEDQDIPDGVESVYDYDLKKMRKFRTVNGVTDESVGLQEGYNTMTAIAAHVTADARLVLYDYIEKAGFENVYYCDTDSIFCNAEGRRRLGADIVPGVLGKLSEKEPESRLVIRGPKDYTWGNADTIKGVRANAERLGENTFRQTRFEGLLSSIRNGDLDTMKTSLVTKTLKRVYKKGTVTETGRVVPFHLTK